MEVPYGSPRQTSILPLILGGLCLGAGLLLLFAGCATPRPPQTTGTVDLERYAGKWYEIASYPAWFQRTCAGGTTAEYTPQPDGTIRVVNRCFTRDGKIEEAVGTATVVPGSGNARLKVSFGVPFIRGNYWILGLDRKSYRWALVGDPTRKYLWILAREPRLSERDMAEVVALAIARGFDESRLRRTDQSRNLRDF